MVLTWSMKIMWSISWCPCFIIEGLGRLMGEGGASSLATVTSRLRQPWCCVFLVPQKCSVHTRTWTKRAGQVAIVWVSEFIWWAVLSSKEHRLCLKKTAYIPWKVILATHIPDMGLCWCLNLEMNQYFAYHVTLGFYSLRHIQKVSL
jgi:hypothetical protein